MRRAVLISLIIVFHLTVVSQNPLVKVWDKRYGGSDAEGFSALIETTDGGFILGGGSQSDSSGDRTQHLRGVADYWMIKTDSLGIKQWDKRYGGSESNVLALIQQTPDGGYLVGGISSSPVSGDKTQPNWDTVLPRNTRDFWIIKTDSLGNKQWDKRYGGTEDEVLFTMVQTTDGGYLFGGSSESDISGDRTQHDWSTFGFWDGWIIKTDSLGNKQWDKRFGGNFFERIHDAKQTTDGGYILAGYTNSDSSGDKSHAPWGPGNDMDGWLVKIDAAGNKEWDKNIGGTQPDEIEAVQQTADGGYILAGVSSSSLSGYKTSMSHDSSNYDYWLVKVDSAGNHQWDKQFGGMVGEDFYSLSRCLDGGYLLSGSSFSSAGGEKTESNTALEQTWIVKTDSLGNKQWDKTIFTPSILNIPLSYALQTKDGCYLVANTQQQQTGGYNTQYNHGMYSDMWLVKFGDTTLCEPQTTTITTGNNSICANDSTQICALAGFINYSWNTGAANTCITTSLAGNYYVTVTDLYACPAISNHLAIFVTNQTPVSVSVNGDTLTAYNAVTYQWYRNDTLISGAVEDRYIAVIPGSYTIAITDTNGCYATSGIIIITDIENLNGYPDFTLYPNPATNTISISIDENMIGSTLTLTDVTGRRLEAVKLTTVNGQLTTENFSNGIYFVTVTNGRQSATKKLVISH